MNWLLTEYPEAAGAVAVAFVGFIGGVYQWLAQR